MPEFAFGTVKSPAWSFVNEAGTGMYRAADATIGWSLLSTNYMTLSTSGLTLTVPYLMPDGAVGEPGLGFSGDTNTGLYSVAADSLGVTVGGVLGLTMTETGGTVTSTFSGPVSLSDSLSLGDNDPLSFGDSDDAVMDWSTAQASSHAFVLGAPLVILTAAANINKNHDHASQTNPTLRGHSGTDPDTSNDEWWSITHDVTNTVFETGSGLFDFSGADISVDATRKIILDGTTGTSSIHEESSTEVRLTTGGVVVFQLFTTAINTSLPFRGGTGAVNSASYSFGADTDTGMYRPADDQLGFTAGGVLGLTLAESGSNVTATFQHNVVMASTKKLYPDGGGDTWLEEESSNVIHLVAGGGSVSRLSTNNNRFYGSVFSLYHGTSSGTDSILHVRTATELLTVSAGTGASGVTTSANLAQAGSQIMLVTCRVTQAPGGGATTFDLGVTGGDLDGFADGVSTAVNTTSTNLTNGASDQVIPLLNQSATTLTLTTDANVTGADLIVRIFVHYIDGSPPTG